GISTKTLTGARSSAAGNHHRFRRVAKRCERQSDLQEKVWQDPSYQKIQSRLRVRPPVDQHLDILRLVFAELVAAHLVRGKKAAGPRHPQKNSLSLSLGPKWSAGVLGDHYSNTPAVTPLPHFFLPLLLTVSKRYI